MRTREGYGEGEGGTAAVEFVKVDVVLALWCEEEVRVGMADVAAYTVLDVEDGSAAESRA